LNDSMHSLSLNHSSIRPSLISVETGAKLRVNTDSNHSFSKDFDLNGLIK